MRPATSPHRSRGTKRVRHLEEDVAAAGVRLDADDLVALEDADV